MPSSEREKNAESFNTIKNYLYTLKQEHLWQKPNLTPEEISQLKALSDTVIQALPESIRSIKLPSNVQIFFGEENDPVRVAHWDLVDIKKFAEHLAKTIGVC